MLPFMAFKSMGNEKRVLYMKILFANSIPVIIQWHESYIAWGVENVCKTSADTQKTVLGKNDHDVYECKSERSFANLTVLSVRFLFLYKVQSFLSFDGRFALFFFFLTLARLGIMLVGKSGSLAFPNVFLFLISSRQKKFALYNFWSKLKVILGSLQIKNLFWNSLAYLRRMKNT